MPLGVGGGELAADIAGACDEPGADRIGAGRKSERVDPGLRRRDLVRRHARDDEVLPDGEADVAVAELARHRCRGRASAPPSSCRRAERRRSSCGRAASARARRYARRDRRPDAARMPSPGTRSSLRPSFSSTSASTFSDAHAVDDVFEPRLVAVGAVAVIDEHAHDGVGHLGRVRGPDHNAGVAREVLVPGDAAEHQPKPHAGRRRRSRPSPRPPESRCRWCPPARG